MAEDGPRIRWRPQYTEVLEDGNLAFSVGLYEYIGKAEDGSEIRPLREVVVVTRGPGDCNDDGVWRVVFDAAATDVDVGRPRTRISNAATVSSDD